MLSFDYSIRTEMKHEYARVTPEIIAELTAIVGRDNVSTSASDIEEYSHDEAPLAQPHIPQVIVRPTDTASIARLLAFASEKRIPVTPRGAGTGLSGGCTPIYSGIVLSMERMNHILRIDKDNFVAILEAGVDSQATGFCQRKENPRYPKRRRDRAERRLHSYLQRYRALHGANEPHFAHR